MRLDADRWQKGETFDVGRLKSALGTLSADNRDIWFRYGAAIYDATAGSREGFDIWDEWSRTTTAGNYNGLDQQKYWNVEFPKREHSKPTTIASIFHDAKEQGWQEPDQWVEFETAPLREKELTSGLLTEQTMADLRETFGSWEHKPSAAQWHALKDLASHLEAMANGSAESSVLPFQPRSRGWQDPDRCPIHKAAFGFRSPQRRSSHSLRWKTD